jgi:transcriptional regulator with GAF, ATPase, and Fis domain
MIVERAFREDLYYRINTVPITVPPLRERREDIAPLARVFLNKAAATSGKTGISLAPAAIEMLEAHSFPGNVRELENLIKRLASAAGQHELIGREAVARALSNSASTHVTPPPGGTAVVPMQSVPLSLTTLPGTLAEVSVDAHDAALAGIKPRLDDAYRALLRRLAGAALERCRDPVSGVINRQRAMQLLTGDPDLKGKGPGRVVNEILGRKQDSGVTEEDLNALVSEWKCLTDRGGKP